MHLKIPCTSHRFFTLHLPAKEEFKSFCWTRDELSLCLGLGCIEGCVTMPGFGKATGSFAELVVWITKFSDFKLVGNF